MDEIHRLEIRARRDELTTTSRNVARPMVLAEAYRVHVAPPLLLAAKSQAKMIDLAQLFCTFHISIFFILDGTPKIRPRLRPPGFTLAPTWVLFRTFHGSL